MERKLDVTGSHRLNQEGCEMAENLIIDPNMRTESEIATAHQSLADFIYPRKVREWERPCDECGQSDVHGVECRSGKSTFQGWRTSVSLFHEIAGKCAARDCEQDATMRIRLNIHGSLYECDVCRIHGMTIDGKSKDGFWCDGIS